MAASKDAATPQPGAKSTTKAARPSHIVVLRLSSSALKFPTHPSSATSVSEDKAASGTPQLADTPAPENETESANATPVPNETGDNDTTVNGQKRKGVPGPKPGTTAGVKRSAPANTEENGTPKARGKPGPKKRVKLDGETNGRPATAAAHPKLGPKANQGAINAGLRALDRTGKPCRRWQKKGFHLKSFTGIQWGLPSWKTSKVIAVTPPDGEDGTPGSSDVKPGDNSSALASDKSNSGGGDSNAVAAAPIDNASSPVPAQPVDAATPA